MIDGSRYYKILLFMLSDETLIGYNEGDGEFIISSGKLTDEILGTAVHEYRDAYIDVQGFVTSPELVTQYMAGMECEEL